MILLRRIALEQGNTYVFEPHGPVLRRAVENHFSRLLDDLQGRGAFAGKTSRQSVNVAVDARPGNADLGRLEVEIGVAPSVPMRFLTLWLLQQGGLAGMAAVNERKAAKLYAEIDRTGFYRGTAATDDRSLMNITFRLSSEELEKRFVKESTAAGLDGLKGHRSVGGMRASTYNAFPEEGIDALVAFMRDFEQKNG